MLVSSIPNMGVKACEYVNEWSSPLQWTTDLDLMPAVREAGLKEVVCLKFYENRTNGQSKG